MFSTHRLVLEAARSLLEDEGPSVGTGPRELREGVAEDRRASTSAVRARWRSIETFHDAVLAALYETDLPGAESRGWMEGPLGTGGCTTPLADG